MISLIVAVAKNNVIGNNGIIPWKIKGKQKRFKELTTGNSSDARIYSPERNERIFS